MNSRRKGHNAERKFAKLFRKIGFPKCTTTRYSSRLKDNCKIDLDFIPYQVQVKAGYKRGIKYQTILQEMAKNILEFLPNENHFPKLIIHEHDVGKGKKRLEMDTIVAMSLIDFLKIINNKK